MNHDSFHIPEIKFNKFEDIYLQWPIIQFFFKKNGFIVLNSPDKDKSTLEIVCRIFGKIQGHPRSEEGNGIVNVKSETANPSKRDVVSNMHFFAHTDGHYLEGMRSKSETLHRVGPPKIIIMQCVEQSEAGGDSFLVDSYSILKNIIHKDPDLLPILFSPFYTSIIRKGQAIFNFPIFRQMPSGGISIRFCADDEFYVDSLKYDIFNRFNQEYICNKDYCTQIRLSEGQILIVDNLRVLHGRTEITGSRFLRRVWIQDQNSCHKMVKIKVQKETFRRNYGTEKEFSDYDHYAPIINLNDIQCKNIQTGIHLLAVESFMLNGLLQGLK